MRLTPTEFGHTYGKGVFCLVLLKKIVLFHHSSLFSHFLSKPHHFAPQCSQAYESLADSVGFFLEPAPWPTLQLGLVPWELSSMIGLSCKAWSQLRRFLPLRVNEHMTVWGIPLHHSALFADEHGYSRYSTGLSGCWLVVLSGALQSRCKLGMVPFLFIPGILCAPRHW